MSESDTRETAILVIRLGALGDAANTIRAVHALRTELSTVRIGWLLEEGARDLVAAAEVADEIIFFPRKQHAYLFSRPWQWPRAVAEAWRFVKRLRAGGYVCALDFQGNLKSGILGALSGARERIGFARGHCRELNWLFSNVFTLPVSKRMPRTEKAAALAQAVAPDLRLGSVTLHEDAAEAERVERFLEQVSGDGPLVVTHPGTSGFAVFKRWPPERFGAVARALSRNAAARCVVTQGPGEADLAARVVAASEGAAHAAPLLSVKGLIELLRRADLVIAGDTGPLHIGALLERPLVAIFGPKDPAVYGPYGTRCEIVRAEVECSPCTRRTCDDVRCIREISVAAVTAAAERMLRGGD